MSSTKKIAGQAPLADDRNRTRKNPTLETALVLAKLGWKLFPARSKDAHRMAWSEKSTSDAKTLTRWFTQWPDDLLCLDCGKSGIGVIDLDAKDGKDGPGNFLSLELEHGMVPEVLREMTPTKGVHIFCRDTEGKLRSVNGKLGTGVDTKGVGGMVVISPSIVKGKGQYQWLDGVTLDNVALRIANLPEVPAWIVEKLGEPRARAEAVATDIVPVYTQEEYAERLNLIPVDYYDDKQDEWLKLMAACMHASTVEDGRDAFMEWTTSNNYGSDQDWDSIEPRMLSFFAKRGVTGTGVAGVGTFNKVVAQFGHADKCKWPEDRVAAKDEFAADPIPDDIKREAEAAKERADEKKRPTVLVSPGFLHNAMDRTQQLLLKQAKKSRNKNNGSTIADQIFKRDGRLVRLNRNLHRTAKGKSVETKDVEGVKVDSLYQEKNALTIKTISEPWLATRLNRSIAYQRINKDGEQVPRDVPGPLVKQLIGDETQWQFPALFSIIEAPTLRADGTILDEPGYDPASGMFFDPGTTKFPRIKPNPTREEGEAAIGLLDDEILSSFPFVDQPGYEGVSKSVALAMLLTGPVRRGISIAPAFAADSNEPESGKSMLIKAAGALMTGREIAGRPFATNEEERRKALGTAFLQASPVLFYDNVDCIIEGASIEMALTSPLFEDRKLGAHEGFNSPTNSLMGWTGNHIRVGGNGMTSRIYVARIVPTKTLKQRLADGDFRHPHLIPWIIEHRPRLIAAVLTALRAFIVHGKASMPSTTSRFVEWGNLIGNALIWYGYPDPVRGGDGLREADPVKEAMREVVRPWAKLCGYDPVTAADLLKHEEIRKAIGSAIGARSLLDVSPIAATGYIKKLVGVNLDMSSKVEALPARPGRRYAQQFKLTEPDIGLGL
jgi:hypothetical protein